MDDRSITVSAYNGLVDHSFTGHVTLSITVGGDTRTCERTIVYGAHVTPHGLTTRGVVQDAPARFTADGVPESPAAVHSNAVSRAQGQAAIDRMEELKSDTYYGIAFNNCADLVDQAFEAAGLKGYERGLGLSGKVNGPITLSLPGYIDQTLSDLNEDLRISEMDFGILWDEAGYFDSNYQRRDFRDLPKDSPGPRCMGYDPDGRNAITEERQYVFTEWDPTATCDLEAIRSTFDSNGDGKLTAADADFAKLKMLETHVDAMRWAA